MKYEDEIIGNINAPEPRSFSKWCEDLGIECQGECPNDESKMTYDEFCILPNVRLRKVRETSLYGFWRKNIDVSTSGEYRTIKEWLEDIGAEIVDPTEKELSDLNLFLGWDEFMDWSSGIIYFKDEESKFNFLNFLKKLFKNNRG